MRSSRLLCTGGESPSPLLHSLGFRQLRRGLLLLQTMVLADDGPRCSCRRCDSDESLARNLNDTRLSSTRPSVSSSEKPKATRMGPTRPETTQGSPPCGLLVSPGDSSRQETHLARRLISPGDSSRQETHLARRLISPGDSSCQETHLARRLISPGDSSR